MKGFPNLTHQQKSSICLRYGGNQEGVFGRSPGYFRTLASYLFEIARLSFEFIDLVANDQVIFRSQPDTGEGVLPGGGILNHVVLGAAHEVVDSTRELFLRTRALQPDNAAQQYSTDQEFPPNSPSDLSTSHISVPSEIEFQQCAGRAVVIRTLGASGPHRHRDGVALFPCYVQQHWNVIR